MVIECRSKFHYGVLQIYHDISIFPMVYNAILSISHHYHCDLGAQSCSYMEIELISFPLPQEPCRKATELRKHNEELEVAGENVWKKTYGDSGVQGDLPCGYD